MLRNLVLPSWDPEIPYERWAPFADTIAALALLCVAAGTLAIVALYAAHARRVRIRRPADVFRPYTPLRWLLLAPLPGLIAGAALAWQYAWHFPGAASAPLGGAVRLFALVTAGTLLGAYALCCLPLVTPARFRYRPLSLFLPRGRAAGGRA